MNLPDTPPAPPTASSTDPRLAEAVEKYRTLLKSGAPDERAAFRADHADLDPPLIECLDALDFLKAAGPGLRPDAPTAQLPDPLSNISAMGTIGDFRIFREIGRGGMGIVYEAEQLSLGRRVALKVLPFAATMDPRQLQRFQNEARAAASLEHPHIVPVHGVGCERGVHYYAMRFIEGQSLAEVIAAQRGPSKPRLLSEPRPSGRGEWQPLPDGRGSDSTTPVAALTTQRAPRDAASFRQIAEWGIQAAEALEYAHSLGIVHRDIKPANLMIDGQGHLWVTDFGLARTAADAGLTMTGDVLGTLRYMSPEQALARHGLVDHRTDVYSLGTTLYELLTGKPAVSGKDREEILNAITLEEPHRPRAIDSAIPRDLETIVLKAMTKEPDDRYATARDLAGDLRRFTGDRPITARPPSLWKKAAKWSQRHKPLIYAAVACLLIAFIVLGVATIVVVGERNEALRQRDLAREQRRFARQEVDDMYTDVAERWL
jgi:serine/threonine protein kinase